MLRRIGVSLIAIMLAMGLVQFPAQSVGSTPVTLPKNPKGLKAPVTLPAKLDPTPAYAPQVSCSPVDLVGPKKLRDLVLATYKVSSNGAISRGCTEGRSEHSEGRAWDWMVDTKVAKEKAAAADFLAWVTANHGENAKRLGIMYVIYNKKIWGVYREKDGWRPSRGHVDHIHISFSWNGARAKTSFWTGKIQPTDYGPCARFAGQPAVLRSTARTAKCYAAVALVKTNKNTIQQTGSKSSTVKTAQILLGVNPSGVFDTATRAAVKAYQFKHDLPWTGTLDVPTWGSLKPGDVTSDVSKGYSPTSAGAYGLKNFAESTLAELQTGKPVLFAQIALGMAAKDRNGYFGPVTTAAVKKFQLAHGFAQTGIVTKAEWTVLSGS